MQHSDYIKLTSLLESIIAGREMLHWAQNEGKQQVEQWPTIWFVLFPDYVYYFEPCWSNPSMYFPGLENHFNDVSGLESMIIDRLKYAWAMMDKYEDAYYNGNQERADNHLGPTHDVELLHNVIARFMSGNELNDNWDNNVRDKANQWMSMANTWFPNLNDNQETNHADNLNLFNKENGITTPPTTIDREQLKGFFNGKFKESKPRPGMEPLTAQFDMFYNALESGTWTPTDIGRIAFQVQQSKYVLPMYRNMPFAKFARQFFDACNVRVPKDLAPRTYKNKTNATDMDCWLN